MTKAQRQYQEWRGREKVVRPSGSSKRSLPRKPKGQNYGQLASTVAEVRGQHQAGPERPLAVDGLRLWPCRGGDRGLVALGWSKPELGFMLWSHQGSACGPRGAAGHCVRSLWCAHKCPGSWQGEGLGSRAPEGLWPGGVGSLEAEEERGP